ncbi:MAG: OmpH family outer membrane protein [Alphaproteobacteria bacterium]
MKSRVVGFVATVALAAAAIGGIPSGAVAQQSPQANIAILDYQRILRDSAAAVDIRAQIERQRQFYQEEITEQEQELRAADQELGRQRAILSTEAFAQKRREFEERVTKVQRGVQTRKRELDQAYDYGLKQVQVALLEIISELAGQRGFNLVLARQQVVFSDKALNISDEVLLRLNERLPKVAVPLAQN